MPDDAQPSLTANEAGLSRRGFTLSVAGAAAAAAAPPAMASDTVMSDVVIETADGMCDAALIHPAGKGAWPAVIVFVDAMGLRPTFREMGKRLAMDGYTVLIPNPFYRSGKAPDVIPKDFSFEKPESRQLLGELRKPMTPEAVDRDVKAYVGFLDTQPAVKKTAKMGVVGYCMGGPMTMQSSALLGAKVGAACSFHGGGLVTDKPDSPHLLIPKILADFYFGVARNDDARQPDMKVKLKEGFEAVGRPAAVEVYAGDHGWCVPDGAAYNKPEAERAWGHMHVLFKAKLA